MFVNRQMQLKEDVIARFNEDFFPYTESSSIDRLSPLIIPFFIIPTFSSDWWSACAMAAMFGSQCVSASSKYSENYTSHRSPTSTRSSTFLSH